MGEEAEVILNSMGASDEKDYAMVLQKFFKVQQNVYERARCNCCSQLGESTEQFIMELYRLVDYCNYKTLRGKIRDRLVDGIRDKSLLEHMQLDTTLDLEKAKMARQHEAIQDESRGLTAGNTTVLKSMSAGKYNNQSLEVNQRDKVAKELALGVVRKLIRDNRNVQLWQKPATTVIKKDTTVNSVPFYQNLRNKT